MRIRDFAVEIWMNRFETRCAFNLAETCVESLTVAELLDLAGKTEAALLDLLPVKLTYGSIEGSDRLRGLIASLYARQQAETIVVTHGAIGANALVYQALVEPGDRVIAIVPTYQQHTSIPESFGADVQVLRLREDHDYLPDLAELARMARLGTRVIAMANPNNPTGALMDAGVLAQIVGIARHAGCWVLCDEVYRGTDQSGDGFTASIADLYEKGISTGSMSKTYALAGLRLGWIAGPADLLRAVSAHRDYTTISVGMLDDHFAALALESRQAILARSQRITRRNLAILDAWVAGEPLVSWVKPKSGTTALLRYDLPIGSEQFCTRLLEATGVMMTPGSAMDVEGTVRIGYANGEPVLREGLARLSAFLRDERARIASPQLVGSRTISA